MKTALFVCSIISLLTFTLYFGFKVYSILMYSNHMFLINP